MSVAELQKKLIEKISKTNDVGLLEEIYNFMGIDEEVEIFYNLSDEQLSIIEDSREQIKNGQSFTDDEINNDTEKWLGK